MGIRIKVINQQKLEEIAARHGYSIRKLANAADLSDTTIQLLVSGKRDYCSPETANKIINALKPYGVKFKDFFLIEYACKSKQKDSQSIA